MRKARNLLVLGFVFGAFGVASACSSNGRPDPGNLSGEAGPPNIGTIDAAAFKDAAEDAPDDSGLPASCRNTIKDPDESDVDCGHDCAPCIDGKACAANDDCAGGQCINSVCTSPLCVDAQLSPGESDVDCGGPICKKCTIGRKCVGGGDCESGKCVNGACACPDNMTIVSRAGGNGAYCISRTEVTKGQYNRFITANQPVTQQDATCLAVNNSFIPSKGWPPATAPAPGLPHSMGLPIHYVDWCDAAAYCKWAGMHLCGKIGGGGLTFAERNDAAKSAWYNACSAQGQKVYPYGDAFDPFVEGVGSVRKCNGNGRGFTPGDAALCADAGGLQCPGLFGYGINDDDGIHRVVASDDTGAVGTPDFKECQGGVVDLYGMSGNVAEWEDACEGGKCAVRGGSYQANNDPAALACNADRTVDRVPATTDDLKDIGFRCCLY
ncbi:MAG: SUMF1/EgtB/PvdO family nonheme iron enzyme [Myxococcales bacterium]|nr:SUMF1/EgtB/PvdO family nonheme iron enzyme [Myxococcales bacterium]